MTAKVFLLPDLGEGLTEGEIVSWWVAVGDIVEVDQIIAVIETAKAAVDLPCPYARARCLRCTAPKARSWMSGHR